MPYPPFPRGLVYYCGLMWDVINNYRDNFLKKVVVFFVEKSN